VDCLKQLQAKTAQELNALRPSILDKALRESCSGQAAKLCLIAIQRYPLHIEFSGNYCAVYSVMAKIVIVYYYLPVLGKDDIMAYRNKTYVCFDGHEDMHYYRLMQAWTQNDGIKFNFFNAHDLNSARDTSLPESIKSQLRERLNNSKVLVVLVGEKTKNLHRFVRWRWNKL